jgi:glycosyltransferase involved in cell wall biosynthesis
MIFERYPDLFKGPSTEYFNRQKKNCILEAEAVLCISEATRQDVIQFYGLEMERAKVIHLAAGSAFRKLAAEEINEAIVMKPYFLYVGSRAHYKKYDLLLDAFSKYNNKGVALIAVGPTWNPDEIRMMKELKVEDRVVLMTGVDDQMLCQLYNSAVAFIYPSLYEGFGIPLLEAMACGCPIIASRIPSSVEIAADCPIYIDSIESDEMIRAFDDALSEKRDSEKIKAGLRRAAQYSWDKTAEETLRVYRSLS